MAQDLADLSGHSQVVRNEEKAMCRFQFPALSGPNKPSAVTRRPTKTKLHGVTLTDDYAWLKAENWPVVLRDPARLPPAIRAVIEAENDYANAMLGNSKALQQAIIKEMRGRIQEEDSEVPRPDGPWLYYIAHRKGGEHPLFCRQKRIGGPAEILLDGDAEANGKDYFDIAEFSHSPDHSKVGFSLDDTGAEFYTIRVRPLDRKALDQTPVSWPSADCDEAILETDGSLVFLADSSGFYYVHIDDNHRPHEVRLHVIGNPPSEDICVFAVPEPGLFIHLRRAVSGRFAIIGVADHDSSETYLLDLFDAKAEPILVSPRQAGVRYDVEPHGERLFIRTNADGAEDFKILSTSLSQVSSSAFVEEVPHKRGCMIIKLSMFPDYLVFVVRNAGLPAIWIRHLASGEEHAITFTEEAYSLGLEERLEYETRTLRFVYSSMTTPWETYDYDLLTRERVLRKRQVIPCGHDPSRYVTRRLFALAQDGEQIPVSLLHRADLALDGRAPLLLYGYGAYGAHVPASFGAERFSLVDRGFVYAIAHVRGGTDKGWHWYLDGKLSRKPNTFSDFICAARQLIADGYTGTGRIIAKGGSAGGMLMGVVANLAPELFAGILADVPFVDVLNTMLDASLPLTPPEWVEWGNPAADPEIFAIMRAYSPYDNVTPKPYPAILALAGLTDPRVTYWEPLKWVTKLRALSTSDRPILLKTNMRAGHAGQPGRFQHLEDITLQYAFALGCVQDP